MTEIDVKKLQKRLEEKNVMIHFDDAWLPKDKERAGEKADIGHK